MGQLDLEINRKTRKVLVRHWLDLGQLSLRSINGRLTLRGSLERIFGFNEELTPGTVETIMGEIRNIPGVKYVSTEIVNWSNETGLWKLRDVKYKESHRTITSSSEQKGGTFIIDEE